MNSFANTVDLTLRPSMRAFNALFLLHTVLLILVALAIPQGPLFLAALAVLAGTWLWLRRHAVFGFGMKAVVRIVWHAEGQWTLYAHGGAHLDGRLLRQSIVLPGLMVLRFELTNGTQKTRILMGDEAPEEGLRRLRARLLNTKENA